MLVLVPFCAAHQLHRLKPLPVLSSYVELGYPEGFKAAGFTFIGLCLFAKSLIKAVLSALRLLTSLLANMLFVKRLAALPKKQRLIF